MEYRDWKHDKKLLSKEYGTITKSARPFGVEIECQYTDENHVDVVQNGCDEAIGFSSDGSINGEGVEIKTPPASGVAAEEMMKNLCGLLNDNGFEVDSSCGLHVHIDAADMKEAVDKGEWRLVQTYWMFYIVFDKVIRSFLPLSRRRNSFCRPMEHVYGAVKGAGDFSELVNIHTSYEQKHVDERYRNKESKDPTRYRGLNLHPLWNGWHSEVRYHNGTIQADRILHWAYLHCLIMDKVMDGTITQEWIEEMKNKRSVIKMTTSLFDKIGIATPSRIYLRARQVKFSAQLSKLLSEEVLQNVEILANQPN